MWCSVGPDASMSERIWEPQMNYSTDSLEDSWICSMSLTPSQWCSHPTMQTQPAWSSQFFTLRIAKLSTSNTKVYLFHMLLYSEQKLPLALSANSTSHVPVLGINFGFLCYFSWEISFFLLPQPLLPSPPATLPGSFLIIVIIPLVGQPATGRGNTFVLLDTEKKSQKSVFLSAVGMAAVAAPRAAVKVCCEIERRNFKPWFAFVFQKWTWENSPCEGSSHTTLSAGSQKTPKPIEAQLCSWANILLACPMILSENSQQHLSRLLLRSLKLDSAKQLAISLL